MITFFAGALSALLLYHLLTRLWPLGIPGLWARWCPRCRRFAVINLDGRRTCVYCGYSKEWERHEREWAERVTTSKVITAKKIPAKPALKVIK